MRNNNFNKVSITLISVLTALCLAIQLTPRPPNVEFTSLFTFTVGFIFGSIVGGFFGGFVMFVNGFLSPWGFAGLNMPFQMAGMSLMGFAGGIYRKFAREFASSNFLMEAPILGAFLTTLYDLITNFGVAVLYYLTGTPFSLALLTALAYGTPFSIIHVLSNAAVFGTLLFPLIKSVNILIDGGNK
jgi:uncharacterized membrane protein